MQIWADIVQNERDNCWICHWNSLGKKLFLLAGTKTVVAGTRGTLLIPILLDLEQSFCLIKPHIFKEWRKTKGKPKIAFLKLNEFYSHKLSYSVLHVKGCHYIFLNLTKQFWHPVPQKVKRYQWHIGLKPSFSCIKVQNLTFATIFTILHQVWTLVVEKMDIVSAMPPISSWCPSLMLQTHLNRCHNIFLNLTKEFWCLVPAMVWRY